MSNEIENDVEVTDTPTEEGETTESTVTAKATFDLSDNFMAFVRAWEESPNVKAVAEATGMEPAACSTKASQIRAKGLKLKKMKKGSQATNGAEAQRFLDSLRQKVRDGGIRNTPHEEAVARQDAEEAATS